MQRRTKMTIGGAVVAAGIATGAGIATAGGGEDSEEHITGAALERASAAALAQTGGGRVTETEVGDEDSFYEVEVTLDDGSQVDVQLDEQFNVVASEKDNDHEDDGAEDESGDDD